MQHFLVYAFLLCLATASAPAAAARQPVLDAPLSKQEHIRCAFNQDGSKDCEITIRYTILKAAGRELLSRIDFTYPETDSFVVREATVTQRGGKPINLDETQIDTRTAANPDEGFTRQHQTSLAFPNLRVGTNINYTIHQRHAATPLARGFHHIMAFPAMPVRVDAFKAEFTAGEPIIWRTELADDFRLTPSSDQKTLVIEQKAPRYLNYTNESEKGFLHRLPRIEVGSSLSLADYFDTFSQRYNEILEAPLPASSAAVAQDVQHLPAAVRVSRLMEYINENYRYLGDWRESERGHVPFTLAEIEQRGYGDCKDLAVLLTAMLRATGIKADPALVARGQFAPSLLIPGTYAPNHAIVRAEVDDAVWWLDPTNLVFIPARSMPDIQERWAIVLAGQGLVREETIALETPAATLKAQRTERYDRAGSAQVSSTVELSNLLLAQVSLSDRERGAAGTDQDLCRKFGRESADCMLERLQTTFIIVPDYRITASLTDLNALQKVSDKYIYQRDDLIALWDEFAAYQREGQQADLYFGDPLIVSHDVTLSGGRFGQTPQNCTVQSPWFDVSLHAKASNKNLNYQYQYVQKKRYLTHEEIRSEDFQKMVEQSRRCVSKLRVAVG